MITRLLRVAAPAWAPLAASTLCRIVSQAAKAGLVVYPAWAVTREELPGLAPFLLAMALLALVAAGGRWAEQVSGHAAAFRLLADMRVRLYEALAARGRAPKGAAGGRLMAVATRDINLIEVFFAHTLVPALCAGLVTIAGCFWIGLDPGLDAPAAATVLIGLGIAWALPFVRRTGTETMLRGEIAQQFSEDQRGRLEIASLGAEPARLRHLDALETQLYREVRGTAWLNSARSTVAFAWPWVGAVVMWWATGRLVPAAIVLAAGPIFQALEGFARTLPQALASARRYFAELEHKPEITEPANPASLPRGPLGVELRGVSLGYGTRPVVRGLDVQIPAGGKLGIVGPTGAGKSTIADAVVRLIEPTAGSVLLGGVDVSQVTTRELRRAVGLVEQSPVLVPGSVLENLRMGNPELDATAAREALARANAAEIDLDAEATKLSGGEQQRVGIARVLARQPRVLVLDEATSHQDAIGQAELTAMLHRLNQVTVVIIAHRAEALAGVDQVIDLAEPHCCAKEKEA